ncbi:MAG: caspase family protein [Bacteroidota bacterium]
MKRTLFILFAIFLCLQLFAQQRQPPQVEWEKRFNRGKYDYINSITNSADGGFVVAGSTYSEEFQTSDILVLKFDIRGNLVWEKTFGEKGDEKAFSIITIPGGEYMVAGYTNSKGSGNKDMWVMKLDDDGNLIWDKTFGGNYEEEAYSITHAPGKGYAVAGYNKSIGARNGLMWIVKLDNDGNKEWESSYGGDIGGGIPTDVAMSVTPTPGGGYAVAGYTRSLGAGSYDFLVLKLDKDGKIIWNKTFGGTKTDQARTILATPDGEYIITGFTDSKGEGNKDIWVLKLNGLGEIIWDKTFGSHSAEEAYSMISTGYGGYVLAGYTSSKGVGGNDMYLLKIDKDGNKAWETNFDGDHTDEAKCAIATPDGGYAIAGKTCAKYKYDSEPVTCKGWIMKFAGAPSKSVENYVSIRMNEWQQKGEFEKTEDYQKRVSDKNRQKVMEKHTLEAIEYYAGKKIELNGASLSKYDADNESYTINIPNAGDYITSIPINEAQSFKQEWLNVRFENPKYGLNKDRFSLVQLDMVINNKIYTYKTTDKDSIREFIYSGESESQSQSLYRGSGDPLKGLNVSKAKKIQAGNYYALLIGIDNYKGIWTPLNNAVRDAQSIERLLRSKYQFDNFKTLYDAEATRGNIIDAFVWLVENVKEKDNVFIYYSGHGEFRKSLNKGYWVPVDAQTESLSIYISNSDIQTFLGGIKSKHTLLISDACFSGDIFRGKTVSVPFENSEKYYTEVFNLASRQAITSGGIEPVMDGGRDGHSVFAYYLLKALNNNENIYIDASQLYEGIKIPVINNSDQSPKLHPIKNTGDEGGQFLFIRK